MKVLIGLPTASGCFKGETLEALMNMRVTPNVLTKVIAGEGVEKARNALVKMALEGGFTHLLFVDADNPPPQDTLKKFLDADKDMICAPVLSRHKPYIPCIFKKIPLKGNDLPGYEPIQQVDTSGGEIIKIDASGMACILIKRKVLETLYKKYEGSPFAFTRDSINPVERDGKIIKEREMSEDVSFCERATNEGFEIYCDTTIRPIHFAGEKFVQFGDQHII